MSWNRVQYIKYPENKATNRTRKVSKEEADKIVQRLNVNKVYHDGPPTHDNEKKMSPDEVDKLLSRIANKDLNLSKTPERRRTGADNYFNAWKADEMLASMKC